MYGMSGKCVGTMLITLPLVCIAQIKFGTTGWLPAFRTIGPGSIPDLDQHSGS